MKVFLKVFVFAFLVIGLMSGCKKDEFGSVSLTFKAEYDGAPLVMFQGYDYDLKNDIQFSTVTFFLTDLELLKADGGSFLIEGTQLVEMNATNQANATAGTVVSFNDIPAGDYTGFRFGIGVPSDLNSMSPADFSSGNDLSNAGYYWDPWGSYIFSKTEGMLDTTRTGTFDFGWLVHTGSDALYRTLEAGAPVNVTKDQSQNFNLIIDYRAMLKAGAVPFDLKNKPKNHQPDDVERITTFVDNYSSAIVIQN